MQNQQIQSKYGKQRNNTAARNTFRVPPIVNNRIVNPEKLEIMEVGGIITPASRNDKEGKMFNTIQNSYGSARNTR